MNVRCSQCGKSYRIADDRLKGKSRIRLRCTACQATFEVPVPPEEAGAVPPGPAARGRSGTVAAAAAAPGELGAGTTQTGREGELLSASGKLRLGTPELPPGKRVSLAVLSGPDQGKVFPLGRPRVVIGRSDAELVIADPEISRRHAVLEVYGDRFVVRDLNSTNGTFVGDRKITAEAIESQEEFRVGTSRMMFIVTTPDE
jgi:S-DNA-T family DNA segregation ATPase FtsK/SpoIIIE